MNTIGVASQLPRCRNFASNSKFLKLVEPVSSDEDTALALPSQEYFAEEIKGLITPMFRLLPVLLHFKR